MISTPLGLLFVVTVASAFRQVENEAMHEQLAVEDGPSLRDLKLNWTRAVTPRLSEEDQADLRAEKGLRPESMVQLEGCRDSKFEGTKKLLGQGQYGAVYKVKKKGTSEFYAMKVPLAGDADAEEAADHEIGVMALCQRRRCEHVLPLLEKDPCVDGKRMANALVTKLMPYDLEKWLGTKAIPPKCFEVVYDAVRSGLDCMHGAGWLHGDLKLDNVLFESYDEDGCPAGLQLADFGLSAKLGTLQLKFAKAYYEGSWHEAGAMFNGVTDTLGITTMATVGGRNKKHFVVDKRLDECSFAMLMMELFDRRVPAIQKELGKGACGAMGPDRNLMMP